MNNQSSNLKAVIMDLDGVITQTASVHANAWKEVFDAYLEHRRRQGKPLFAPFTHPEDYLKYVDGKPRYDGVRSFLRSRQIDLPEGRPGDAPGWESVCAIGNKKNVLFNRLLEQGGAVVFPEAEKKIRTWKKQGLLTAVVSSSKNAQAVLKAARIEQLFDVRVDGLTAEEHGLPGKPAPDIFTWAARQLDVRPRQAIVMEDARAGVQAGRAGDFGLVAGVARGASGETLLQNGADVTIRSLDDLTILPSGRCLVHPRGLPSALQHLSGILQKKKDRSLPVFLDYDGTLTPIVNDPEKAFISESMRGSLRKLARQTPTAIVSGRDVKVIQDFVNLDSVTYAGSHGFDIHMADNTVMQYEDARSALPVLGKAAASLKKRLSDMPEALIEHKRFAIAVHYRNVSDSDADRLVSLVEKTGSLYPELRLKHGKKVVELQPDIDWHKGRAVMWLLKRMGMSESGAMPLYLGDDVTDEDAFLTLQDNGTGILVGDHGGHTAARFRLENTDETMAFIDTLTAQIAHKNGEDRNDDTR